MPVQERSEAYMSVPELVKALRRIRTMDELRCFGCGHEHNCSIHGCTIIRQAVDVIEALYGYLTENISCTTCSNGNNYYDCLYACNSIECYMDDARKDCYCRGCVDHSKWVWRGPEKEVMQNDEPRS